MGHNYQKHSTDPPCHQSTKPTHSNSINKTPTQVGIGGAMAVATLAGLPGLSASNPGLAKLVYGVVGLPCGLLMTATTVRDAFG
jgi:hypothetical protein